MTTQPERLTAKTSTLAAMLKLSSRRIQQLCALKILPQPGPQGHDLVKAVSAYVTYLQRPSQTKTLADAKQKLIEMQTAIKKLELEQRTGALVSQDSVDQDFFRIGREMREGLGNLPPRVAALVANESSQEKCFQIIKQEIDQILEVLCAEKAPDPGSDSTRPRPAARRHSRDLAPRRGSA